MGIGDVADSVKEEAEEMDDGDVKELADDLEDYLDRIESLKRVMDNMDARMENIEADVKNIKNRLSALENASYGDDSKVSSIDEIDERQSTKSQWQPSE